MIRKLHELFLQSMRCERGGVLVMLAASIILLVTAAGAAIDMSRAQTLQERMSAALDAAGLAAGTTVSSAPSSLPGYCSTLGQTTWVGCQAQKYFNANFPSGYLGSSAVTVTAALGSDNSTVSLSATTIQTTTLMQVAGVKTITVGASTTITRATTGMELVLVLDNTGSMEYAVDGGSVSNSDPAKILALKCAAGGELATGNNGTCAANGLVTSGLLDILYGSNATLPNVWVGLVPFTQAVNIGTGNTSWLNTTADANLDFGPVITGSTCPNYTACTNCTPASISGTYTSISQRGYPNGPQCQYTITSTISAADAPNTNFGMANWGGCVESRSPTTTSATYSGTSVTYDISDDVPTSSNSATLFPAYYFSTQPTNYCVSRNNPAGCDSNEGNYDNWYSPAPGTSNASSSYNSSTHVTTYSNTTTYNFSVDTNLSSTTYNLTTYLGPNALCPQPITPMVAEKATIDNAINSMVAGGDTDLSIGLAWGWRLLSPNWRGSAGGFSGWGGEMATANTTPAQSYTGLPLNYNTTSMNKVVVFMTDGMDRWVDGDYSAYGYLDDDVFGTTNELTAEEDLDTQTLAACTAMKNEGIIIYTIGFGQATTDNPPTENDRGDPYLVDANLLKSCATDANHYFLAPTNAQLETAFQAIGGQLSNLRVSQ